MTGLGPVFHVDVCVTNQGKSATLGLRLVVNYNDKLYVMRKFSSVVFSVWNRMRSSRR